jgi:D-amino peptidase
VEGKVKVYILVDMEGGSGVFSFRLQTYADGRYNETAKRLVTGDTNAAIAGAFDGGAEEVVVFDSHGSGAIDFERLDPRASLMSMGAPAPYGMDSSFGALFQVAQHAMAGTVGGVLCHSYSSREITGLWLNGRQMGEMGIRAAMAGASGIPFVLETGDQAACLEAQELVPAIETACVKWGYSQESALLLHPQRSSELIREKAARAVQRAPAIAPLKVEAPYELKVAYVQEQRASELALNPQVQRIDGRTVLMRGNSLAALERALL